MKTHGRIFAPAELHGFAEFALTIAAAEAFEDRKTVRATRLGGDDLLFVRRLRENKNRHD